MRSTLLLALGLLLAASPHAAKAQGAPSSATDILLEEVHLLLENMIGVSIDEQMRIADV